MKYILLGASFLLVSTLTEAQTDSLEILQKEIGQTQTVEEKVDLLNKLSYEYTQLSLSSAEIFANEALQLAIENDYKKGMAASYNNLGISHSIRGDYSSGLDYFQKALDLREALGDISGMSRTMSNIARVFHYQGDYQKALDYSNRSIEQLRKANDSVSLAQAYIAVGMIHLAREDRAQALEVFEVSREIFSQQKRRPMEGWSLLKISNALEADGQLEKALNACLEAQRLIDARTDLFSTIELHQAIGSIYMKMGRRAEARNNLIRSMRLSDSGKDSNGSISSRLKLAGMFRQFGQLDSALYYMDDYVRHYTDAFNAEKSKQISTLEKAYEADKKDKLLILKNQQIRSQSLIISAISLLLVVMVILGFVLYRYYRSKKQSAHNLEKLNREIYEKHEEILAQSEELTQANEEIKRMNESLEAEVTLRSQKIEEQNKKLIDYAYFNAHNVRGPLARILGLTFLMAREEDVNQIKEYNGFLIACAQELDHVVKDINSKLDS